MYWRAALFTAFCPHKANILQWKTRGVSQRQFQKGVRVQKYHLYTQKNQQLLITLKPDTWPAKALALHLETWPVEPEISWTFLVSWTRTDALDSCSVNGRSRCVKLSPWLRPGCGFHLSSKLCWSALAEQHPSGMYRVLTTAVFVLCKEDMSRTVQSA